jgi:hypothetical protein
MLADLAVSASLDTSTLVLMSRHQMPITALAARRRQEGPVSRAPSTCIFICNTSCSTICYVIYMYYLRVNPSRVWVRVWVFDTRRKTRTLRAGTGFCRVGVRVWALVPGGLPVQIPSDHDGRGKVFLWVRHKQWHVVIRTSSMEWLIMAFASSVVSVQTACFQKVAIARPIKLLKSPKYLTR